MMEHRSGFVNIIGKPNAGKSTLMNQLVGEKLSIITPKIQTTRHRILGLVNGENFQIVYSDTPGILDPKYKLHEKMMSFVYSALEDADVILLLIDLEDKNFEHEKILEAIRKAGVPLLILLNKIDKISQEDLEKRVEEWAALFPQAEILPLSALHALNVDVLQKKVLSLLPMSEAFFPKDELSNRPTRFFVSEIIREKIFLNYKKEIPYSSEVVIESFEEEESIIRIRAVINVARNSQKGILIGHKGERLKKVGIESRKDIEKFLEKHVHLEMFVKVDEDWRNKENKLKNYGYNS